MPRPSPRKMGKVRDISDSPERIGGGRESRQVAGDRGMVSSVIIESEDRSVLNHQQEQEQKQRRKINNKILKEIRKHVPNEAH